MRHGVDAVHEGLAHEGLCLARRVEHGIGFERGQPYGLFAQHVLARFGGLDGPLGVLGMRGGDIDGIDIRVGEQGVVAIQHARARKCSA